MSTIRYSKKSISVDDATLTLARIVGSVKNARRPILLTRRGKAVAVAQSISHYEAGIEERSFLKGIVRGLVDLDEGREVPLAAAKRRLDLV